MKLKLNCVPNCPDVVWSIEDPKPVSMKNEHWTLQCSKQLIRNHLLLGWTAKMFLKSRKKATYWQAGRQHWICYPQSATEAFHGDIQQHHCGCLWSVLILWSIVCTVIFFKKSIHDIFCGFFIFDRENRIRFCQLHFTNTWCRANESTGNRSASRSQPSFL